MEEILPGKKYCSLTAIDRKAATLTPHSFLPDFPRQIEPAYNNNLVFTQILKGALLERVFARTNSVTLILACSKHP